MTYMTSGGGGLVLQNRRKFTIDYRIESAAHNRLYHRLLQLKFLKATSY